MHLTLLSWVCLFLFACSNDDTTEQEQVDTYQLIPPENFPDVQYTVENNPITQKGFELGRKLFFDPKLSVDGSVSCNNCHQHSRAFADTPLHPFSFGVDQTLGIRNAQPLFNLAFRKEFFWDGGVTHLDFVPINAIESDLEMKDQLANVVDKLNRDDNYPTLFKEAFGSETVTSPRMLQALSQFMLLMVSNQSKYDDYLRDSSVFDEQETKGLTLFQQHCTSCHSGILLTDQSFRNNGISENFEDKGRALITESNADEGKFLVPSLRNIEVTAPYMHNAQFATLEEVLDHYSNGVKLSSTLDPLLQNGEQLGIPLKQQEKEALIAFLKTLTDTKFLNDPKFRNIR